MRKLSIITAILTVALIGIYYLIESMIPKGMGPGGPIRPVEVVVVSAKVKPITNYKILPARIRSAKISEIRPQVSGIILKRYFKEGSFVKKGQPLYQIDPKPYFVELSQAEAELNAAKVDLKTKEDQLERFKKLYKLEAVSKLELDNAKTLFEKSKADLSVKKANLDKAEIKIDYTKVLAPIDGKIGRSFVTQGALVKDMQESPLAIITNLDIVYADISQSSAKIEEIQAALASKDNIEVELLLPDKGPATKKKGLLKFSEAIINESTGSVSLRAEFDNTDHKLLPGLFVKAKLNLGTKNSLTIDQSAVKINPDGTKSVYLVDENETITIRQIEISDQYSKDWAVSSGLTSGDLVVKEGVQKIRPGSKVIPTMAKEEMLNAKKRNKKIKKQPILANDPKDNKEGKEVRNDITLPLPKTINNNKDDIVEVIKDNLNLSNEPIKTDSLIEKDRAKMYDEKIHDFIKRKLEAVKKETGE